LEAGNFLTEIYFLSLTQSQSNEELSRKAHGFLRAIATRSFGTAAEQFVLKKNEYGKPYLESYPDFHFNISHTKNAIAIAISGSEIGVDIERLREPDLKIAHRFFTKNEVKYIEAGDVAERFFEIWTKKEAYIKWQGKGLAIPLRSFDVLKSPELFCFLRLGEYSIALCQENLPQKFMCSNGQKKNLLIKRCFYPPKFYISERAIHEQPKAIHLRKRDRRAPRQTL
jgi:4'-phosphopantetheinyl transferase